MAEASLPRDTRDHLVRVAAAGYATHSETVRFEGEVSMLVTPTKAAAAPVNPAKMLRLSTARASLTRLL